MSIWSVTFSSCLANEEISSPEQEPEPTQQASFEHPSWLELPEPGQEAPIAFTPAIRLSAPGQQDLGGDGTILEVSSPQQPSSFAVEHPIFSEPQHLSLVTPERLSSSVTKQQLLFCFAAEETLSPQQFMSSEAPQLSLFAM